ncbi:MAG: hypothetical protein IPM54_27105 [Polyangiaceae bacterium]|nr:hypothetical protein [Polyangiaceae bacterium]
MHRFRLGVSLIGTVIVPIAIGFGDVAADEPDAKTRAQTLFLEGRKAIDGGNWAGGCPKVRQSLELFAVANSHFTVAQCDERDGRIASALEHWERGMALVDDPADPRTKVAKERIGVLDPRVPRIRVVTPAASARAAVIFDDAELSPAELVRPLRVNPGKHVFVIRAKGRQDVRREITIAERERTEFVVTIGAPVASVTGSATAAPSLGGPAPPPPPPHPRRVAGFVVGGLGVVGLLASAGTAYGVSSADDEIEACGDGCSMAQRNEKVSQYKSLLVANTVTFGVGLAGIGAGLILVLTAPKSATEKPKDAAVVPLFMPGGAGIGLSGRF